LEAVIPLPAPMPAVVTQLMMFGGSLENVRKRTLRRSSWSCTPTPLVEMANHALVILVAGNHGAELEGDLYVFGRPRGKHAIYPCTEPEFIELGEAAVAVFSYPRKAVMAGNKHSLDEAFAQAFWNCV
jgi:hypothetical protein